jgi:hypothetical protein
MTRELPLLHTNDAQPQQATPTYQEALTALPLLLAYRRKQAILIRHLREQPHRFDETILRPCLLILRQHNVAIPDDVTDLVENTHSGLLLGMPGIFIVTEQHIKLLHHLRIVWYRVDDLAYGVPGANNVRPYGNSDVYKDIARILGISPEEKTSADDAEAFYSAVQLQRMQHLHEEMGLALQIFLHTGTMQPGVYIKHTLGMPWRLATDEEAPLIAETAERKNVIFTV